MENFKGDVLGRCGTTDILTKGIANCGFIRFGNRLATDAF